jgi:DNA sulfur modification protein DndB
MNTDPAHAFQGLTPLAHRAVRKDLKSRSKLTNDDQRDYENKLWTVVHGLQPTEITVGRDPAITLQSEEYHPDVFAMFDTFALIGEATHTSSRTFVTEELGRIEAFKPQLSRYLTRELGGRKLVCLLTVKDKAELHQSIHDRASKSGVKLLDERNLDYYLALLRDAGVGIFHLFFGRIAPTVLNVGERTIPAIQIKEGRRYKYIFSVSPHELLERAFVSHREITAPQEAQLGYQRMLSKKKLTQIVSYINKSKGFPSPIIVSFPRNAGENFNPLSKKDVAVLGDVTLGHLRLPTKPASVYVVDGQHRLYGYTLVPRSEEHQINVIAYKGLQPRHQGSMFVDINLNQTRVPSRLLWELYPDILSPEDDEYYKAVVSRAVERLIPSELSGMVTHISSGTKGRISFHALCTEIVRAKLVSRGGAGIVATVAGNNWDAQEERLYVIVSAFFSVLFDQDQAWPEVNKRFFLQNTGLIPLIRELGKACKHLTLVSSATLKSSKPALAGALAPYFQPLYEFYGPVSNQQLDDLKRSRVGSSGFIETEDEMDDVIREIIPAFPLRERRSPPELHDAACKFAATVMDIDRLAEAKSKEWIFSEFDKERAVKAISRPAHDAATLERFLGILYQELIEASVGKGSQNRALNTLGLADLNQVPSLRGLALLRHMSAHRASHLEPARRKEAVQVLRQLSGVDTASDFDDLKPDRCLALQLALLARITTDFLEPLTQALKA